MLTQEEFKLMLDTARESEGNAFVLGHNPKGAAVLTEDGRVFGGCNVEGIVSGLGICAERCALDHAAIHGEYTIKAVMVLNHRLVYPCGACLQYLSMFAQVNDRDIEVYAVTHDGKIEFSTLNQLLPKRYLNMTKVNEIKKYNK